MKKIFFFIYAIACYVLFLMIFIYLIGFVENISAFSFAGSLKKMFPKTLDNGISNMPVLFSILADLLLLLIFGLQHSVMARKSFKNKWTKIVPAPIERSTYVLFTSLALILFFYFWQPKEIIIWNLSNTYTGYIFIFISLLGWWQVIISTFLLNHFDLFGLRQVYHYAANKQDNDDTLPFRVPLLYRLVRHPLYFGFLIAFWITPVMTVGHLIFSLGMTTYIFIGIHYEEKDLKEAFGDQYYKYRIQVPKIIPFTTKHKKRIGNSE